MTWFLIYVTIMSIIGIMVAQNKKLGKGGARLPPGAGPDKGRENGNFELDIAPHSGRCEDPTPVFCPSPEMVWVGHHLL